MIKDYKYIDKKKLLIDVIEYQKSGTKTDYLTQSIIQIVKNVISSTNISKKNISTYNYCVNKTFYWVMLSLKNYPMKMDIYWYININSRQGITAAIFNLNQIIPKRINKIKKILNNY
jgi:hypothetical protein